MRIDKKSLVRAAILSAVLGLNSVTTMGMEDRPRDRSRWDINNPQNDNATQMIEMDELDEERTKELVECSVCLEEKETDKVLKTYCCKHDICEECIKGIHEMARSGEGYRTKNRCPFCRNDEFEKWGKLVKKVVKPEKDEDNSNLKLSEKDREKIGLMDSKQRKAVIDSLKAAANARSQQNDLLEKIAAQKEKGNVDPELEKELKLQREIEKNHRDAVAWDLENADVRIASDKTSSGKYSYDQKSSELADKAALEQAISTARRDKKIEETKYGYDKFNLAGDIATMEYALGVLNGTGKKEEANENFVDIANNDQYVAQDQKTATNNDQFFQECLQDYYQQQAAQQQAMYQQAVQQQMYQQAMYQQAVQQQMYQQPVYQQPMMYQQW